MLTVLGEAIVDLVAEGDRRYVAHPGRQPAQRRGRPRPARPAGVAGRAAVPGPVRRAVPRPPRRLRRRPPAPGRRGRAVHPRGGHPRRRRRGPRTTSGPPAPPTGSGPRPSWPAWSTTSRTRCTPARSRWSWSRAPAGSLDLLARVAAVGRTTISYDPNVRMAEARAGRGRAGRGRAGRRAGPPGQGELRGPGLALPGRGAGGRGDRGGRRPARSWSWSPSARTARWRWAGPAARCTGTRRRSSVVDTVGAGDAFSSGLLGALAERGALGRGKAGLAGVDLPAVLDRAILVASLTCARPGADPPTLAEVAEAENPRPGRASADRRRADGRRGHCRPSRAGCRRRRAGRSPRPARRRRTRSGSGRAARARRRSGGTTAARCGSGRPSAAACSTSTVSGVIQCGRGRPVAGLAALGGPGQVEEPHAGPLRPPRAAPRTAARPPRSGTTARPRSGSGSPRSACVIEFMFSVNGRRVRLQHELVRRVRVPGLAHHRPHVADDRLDLRRHRRDPRRPLAGQRVRAGRAERVGPRLDAGQHGVRRTAGRRSRRSAARSSSRRCPAATRAQPVGLRRLGVVRGAADPHVRAGARRSRPG